MNLPERLRSLRSERDWTLKTLASACGQRVPYLSDLERGRLLPSLDVLSQIAGAYGLTIHALLEDVQFTGADGSERPFGQALPSHLPNGLAELVADPILGSEVTPEWVSALARIELRGRRPEDKWTWFEVFTSLRQALAAP